MSNSIGFNYKQKYLSFLYEFIGTTLFLYAVLMTRDPAAIVFTLFASTVIFGRVSNGHFNPAISTSVLIGQDINIDQFWAYLLYVSAQCLAAFPAVLLAQASLHSGTFSHVELNRIHRLCPQSTANTNFPEEFLCENEDGTEGFHMDYQILIIQAVGTLVLCFVLNYVTGKYSASKDQGLRGLSYASTFMLLIYTARRQGWCFNPAVALAICLQEAYNAPNAHDYLFRYTYAYVSGPIIGALLSGLIYMAYEAEIAPKDDKEEVVGKDE